MSTYEFTVVLDRSPSDEDYDRLFEAGLDDTTPETRGEIAVLHVAREASSIDTAVLSVLAELRAAGFYAIGLEGNKLIRFTTSA